MAVNFLNQATNPNTSINPVVIKDANISGTTGSPTIATYTDTGIDYKTYAFTGSGSITFDSDGLIDILLIGGGAGSGASFWGGGGGGGFFGQNYSHYITAATHTVTIGAGGTAGVNGNSTTLGSYANTTYLTAIGGGCGANTDNTAGFRGANSGGGGGDGSGTSVTLITNFGYGGGAAGNQSGGGGGGAAQNGGNGSGVTFRVGGNGGNGKATTFKDGSSIYFCGGGFGRGSAANGTAGLGGGGTANTGGGGNYYGSGGSGLVVIRVRT
jgi:hypothetical protein